MILMLQIICLLALLGIIHTYLLYPLLLYILSRGKKRTVSAPASSNRFQVSVLMAAYNEEAVLAEKLENLAALDAEGVDLDIYVGSDASTDATNTILTEFQSRIPRLHTLPFRMRRGKPSVLNDLAAAAQRDHGKERQHLFIITDANVFLSADLLQKLVPHFSDPDIALVDTRMVNTGTGPAGISTSEATYISLEGKLKQWESAVWKTMMGPFGGCYALRADQYRPVPPHFLVDDFFIALSVFSSGKSCINEPDAVVYETASQDITEEFRRKARISAGNFQNLAYFRHLLLRPFTAVGFAFWSHKVLRWVTPLLLLLAWITSGILAVYGNFWFSILFLLLSIGFGILPLLDRILQSFDLHLLPLRHLRYFVRMNVALLTGMNRYRRGIKGGVWEPTKRITTDENQH